MFWYVARRLLIMPLILLGVSFITFGMFQLLPPIQQLSAFVRPDELKNCDLECIQGLLHKYGLDKPVWERYITWIWKILHGDFGFSVWAKRPVMQAVIDFFPATLEIAIYSFVPVIFIGIWLGVLSAVRQNTLLDHSMRIFAILGYAFPSFVLGLMILLVGYGMLHWFPPERLSTWANQVVTDSSVFVRYTHLNTMDGILNSRWDITWDALRHLAGPVLNLSVLNWALLLRVMRSSMLEELRQDYVRTARAKGVAEGVVVKKHARRNALISTVTISGFLVLGFFTGGAITETIFAYRGLGYYFVYAATQLDYAAVLGTTLLIAGAVVVMNLIVDILYTAVDPRVRLE